jgi:hypothetical protein
MHRMFGLMIVGALPWASSASAALIGHYPMDLPTPLAEATPTFDNDRPDLVTTASPPTHLPAGGVSGSGAYDFDGNDSLAFGGNQFLFMSPGVGSVDYTVSFWVKTTDTGTFLGYPGTPQVPVLGDSEESVGYALGVDGGVAAWRHYVGGVGWEQRSGTIPIADGEGHFVTFVFDNIGTLDIYIDGEVDLLDLPVDPGAIGSYAHRARFVGRSYMAGTANPHFADATVDDIRVYDTALTQLEIKQELGLPIPEPVSGAAALLGAGVLLSARRRAGR